MTHTVGEKCIGTINKIQETGIFVTLSQETFGFMPRKFMPSLYDDNRIFKKNKFDKIPVVVYDINDKGITLCDPVFYGKEQERKEKAIQMRIRKGEFASKYEVGQIFEAEVMRITDSKVYIRVGNIEGIVTKDEASWNAVNPLHDLLFEGEILKAVYIEHENDQLFFSIKLLNKEPYNKELYDLTLNDLLRYAGYESTEFIGQAKQYGQNWFLENLYCDYGNQKGKILIDPIYGYNLRALVPNGKELKENDFYRISLNLVPQGRRIERNQLFQFSANKVIQVENPCRDSVNLTFEKHTSPASSVATAHLLSEVGKNMYSSKDRMFFELIQNADDAASKNGVYVNVRYDEDYLVIQHNGNSFDKDDFEAITSAANGTKKANENKTGYKGIGFKSVFTDSEQVYIKTGGYQFKFDKFDTRFTDFDNFYFAVNRIETQELQQRFVEKFNSERRKFRGVADIPWQLLPIWVDKYPDVLGADFVKFNVAIALKLGRNKIQGETGYLKAIDEIISNPKFMLFLRNTKRIDYNGKSVSKTTDVNTITLKNSFNNNRVELFEKEDFTTGVTDEVFARNGIEIRIKIEKKDDGTGNILDAKFVDLHNQELENIPSKIAINSSTTISFAVPLTEDRNLNPNKKCTDISLFAFLPTLVKDFKFPFYINANFILDPPRQRILGDNPWNFYLMQEIARNLVKWCAKLSEREDVNSLNILTRDYFQEDTTDVKKLAEHFNNAYRIALESEAFILNHNSTLSKQEDVIIDRTGLSNIIGASNFCEIIQTNKCLPSEKIDSSILKHKLFEKIENIQVVDVVSCLAESETLNKWYISASDEQKSILHKWLIDNQSNCKEIINSLLTFKFDNEFISRNHIEQNSDYIIITERIEPIKYLLSKLGYKCSDDLLSTHPLHEYINSQAEKDLYNDIIERLSGNEIDFQPDEKLLLINTLAKFHSIGTLAISQMKLFCNLLGEKTPLCEMVPYKENVPAWLQPYVLRREEDYIDLSEYLVRPENEFPNIVWKNKYKIGISLTELYAEYRWSDGKYTKELIDAYKGTDGYYILLPIVEESDKTVQKLYLKNIERLDLSGSQFYKKESFEYRVLLVALVVFDNPSEFSSKVYFDGVCIKNFTITDDVICDYPQSGTPKKIKMSLAKLLPQYQNQSDSIEKIKNLFENKKELDKFFDAKAKPINEVYSELNAALKMIHATYAPWTTGQGNSFQYLFSVYQRKKSWNDVKGLKIKLEDESDVFIAEMMNFLYDNNIGIGGSPFTYHLNKYFHGKYLNSDFILKDEQLMPEIEKWADTEQKKNYLYINGVESTKSNAIIFRQKFVANQAIEPELINSLTVGYLISALRFSTVAETIHKPFEGNNQMELLFALKERGNCKLSSEFNMQKLSSNSEEWLSPEYEEWIKSHFPRIFLISSQLPQNLYFDGTLLMRYNRGSYYYDNDNKKLYISQANAEIDDILFQVAKEGKYDFDIEDYHALCLKGKIAISKEEMKMKNATIEKLQQQNQAIDILLKKYIEKFGDINVDDTDTKNRELISLSQSQLAYNKSVINKPQLSQEEQIEAHKEAELIIKEKLEQDGYDCSNWMIDKGTTSQELAKWRSINQIENINNPDGNSINLVIKSAKSGYIYLSATDFEFLTSNGDNILMVWDGREVQCVTSEQIFNKSSDINLIFDTEYTPKHYYAALSRVFQYVKRTTFAVKNPKYNAYDAIQTFGMDSQTTGVQELFDDNDL